MSKPLPKPTIPPSSAAARLIRSLTALAERPANSPEEYAQRVVDLHHVEVALRELLDPAYYRAVSSRYGGVSFSTMARLTGLTRSAVQRRVNLGAEAHGAQAADKAAGR